MRDPMLLVVGFIALSVGMLGCLFGADIVTDIAKNKQRDWVDYAFAGMEFFVGIPIVVVSLFIFRAAF